MSKVEWHQMFKELISEHQKKSLHTGVYYRSATSFQTFCSVSNNLNDASVVLLNGRIESLLLQIPRNISDKKGVIPH